MTRIAACLQNWKIAHGKKISYLQCHFQKQPPEVFYEKRCSWNFTEFTVKHLCQSLSFHKVAELRPVTLLNKRIWHRCFPVNFTRFLKTSFLKENLRWLLLPFPLISKDLPLSKIFPEILAWSYNLYTIYHYRL